MHMHSFLKGGLKLSALLPLGSLACPISNGIFALMPVEGANSRPKPPAHVQDLS